MRCPVNKILVTIEQKYQDKQNGLFIDTTFQPEEFATLKGIVHSIPLRVDVDTYNRKKVDQIILPGDEIWFSYGVVFDYKKHINHETPVYKNLSNFEGKELWQVDYGEVYCIVRDGQILMPTQHVLLEPIKDDSPETFASGLLRVDKKNMYSDRAKVVALPEGLSCKPGDVIPVETQFLQKYVLFDKPMFIIPTRRLIAKF